MTDRHHLSFDFGEVSAQKRRGSPDDSRTFLALSEVTGLGRMSIRALYDHYPTLTDVWTAHPEELTYVLQSAKNRTATHVANEILASRDEMMTHADRQLARFKKQRVSIMFDYEDDYPVRLKKADGPRWLFVQGNRELLNRQSSIAIVGTRTPNDQGLRTARRASEMLAKLGFVIVSGLADGIDTQVHQAVVESMAETIAVLGNGLNVEFPAGSAELRRKIVQRGGAIVTEYLWNERYSRSTFVERNRIQAGISGAVLPIQCRARSGTAHTIRFAIEMNRMLFGVSLGKWKSTVENEVFDVLAKHSAPVFDIASNDGFQSLIEYLNPILSDLAPPPHMDDEMRMSTVYAEAMNALWAVIERRKPEGAEAQWLLDEMMNMLSAASEKP